MSKERPTISLVITTESLAHSIAKDLLTAFTVGAPIVLNELTVQSTFLNFVFGAMLLVYVIARGTSHVNNRIVRGDTVDDVISKLKPRLEKFMSGEES